MGRPQWIAALFGQLFFEDSYFLRTIDFEVWIEPDRLDRDRFLFRKHFLVCSFRVRIGLANTIITVVM